MSASVESRPSGAYLLDPLGQRLQLQEPVTALGRDPRWADVLLTGELVSRRHLWLLRPPGSPWVLIDCRSSNGVQVGGEQVTRRVLWDGDRIQVGEHELVFHLGESRDVDRSTPSQVPAPDSLEGVLRHRERCVATVLRTDPPLRVELEARAHDSSRSPPSGFERLRTLHAGCRRLFEIADLQELLDLATLLALECCWGSRGLLYGVTTPFEGAGPTLLAHQGRPWARWDGPERRRTLVSRIAERRQATLLRDPHRELDPGHARTLVLHDHDSLAAAPVLVSGFPRAVLWVERGRDPMASGPPFRVGEDEPLDSDDLQRLAWIAEALGAAWELLEEA